MNRPLAIAIPWNLSHFIPLNGFHPLYRALFDNAPNTITLNAWNNLELSNTLRNNPTTRNEILQRTQKSQNLVKQTISSPLTEKYLEAFFPANITLTASLPGDIELLHTAPFPSLTRPFIIHCESFMPTLQPFAHQGGGTLSNTPILREAYTKILAHKLCLGIFSHIPETLSDFSAFFQSRAIDRKLHTSTIGLSPQAISTHPSPASRNLSNPKFLFINSAHQNISNFTKRGGHIVLRAWPHILHTTPTAKLYLRCRRPTDETLQEFGVNLAFIKNQESKSIIWIEEYLSHHELDIILSQTDFFLLPSFSLHSVSIMHALARGAVPIVTDTIGTSRYIAHNQNGIILTGVKNTTWARDPDTGIMIDQYQRNPPMENSLVSQLSTQIQNLLKNPATHATLRENAIASATSQFSGQNFATHFWSRVTQLWNNSDFSRHPPKPTLTPPALTNALIKPSDWAKLFESVPQPMTRIFTGKGQVAELAGNFIHLAPKLATELHDWSPIAEYCANTATPLTFANNIADLKGIYLTNEPQQFVGPRPHQLIQAIAERLIPYPPLYNIASKSLRLARRIKHLVIQPASYTTPECLVKNISGLKLYRCRNQFFAIPENEPDFSYSKAKQNTYTPSFNAPTIKQLLALVAQHNQSILATGKTPDDPPIFLIEENVAGFNIIRCAELFFAIPQTEGAFDFNKALASAYTKILIEPRLSTLKSSIAATP